MSPNSALASSAFMKSLLYFIIRCALSFIILIPWFLFVPLGFPLWLSVFVLSIIDTLAALNKKHMKNISVLKQRLANLYFFIALLLLLCTTAFVLQFHPVIVIFAWIITLLLLKRSPSIIPLQILNMFFIILVIYNGFIAPKFQKLKQDSCVRVLVSTDAAVRNIFTDDKEENLYFTAYSSNPDPTTKYKTFFQVPLMRKGKIKSILHSFCYDGAYDKKRKVIYLLSRFTNEILIVSPETLKILKRFEVAGQPAAITMDEKRDTLIILFEWGMAIYDAKTFKKVVLLDRKNSANFVQGIVLKKWDKFCAVCFTLGGVQERELKTGKITRKKHLLTPWGITTDKDEKHIYVTDFLTGKLSILDMKSFRIVKSIRLKSGIRPVEVDDRRNLIYVGNYLDPYLIILNKELKILKKIYVGNPCRDIKLLKNQRLFAGTNLGLMEITVNNCKE